MGHAWAMQPIACKTMHEHEALRARKHEQLFPANLVHGLLYANHQRPCTYVVSAMTSNSLAIHSRWHLSHAVGKHTTLPPPHSILHAYTASKGRREDLSSSEPFVSLKIYIFLHAFACAGEEYWMLNPKPVYILVFSSM